MPSSDPLARPAEWPVENGAKYRASLVFVVVLGLACVPVGFGFVGIGKPAALKYALLFAVLFLLTAAFGYITRIRSKHGTDDIVNAVHDGRPVTEIRYSQAAFAILAGLMTCVAAVFVLAALDFALAGDDVPASTAGAAMCGIAALFFLSFLVLVAAGRLRRGRILLSQQGIHQHGRAFSSFLPWTAFAGVKAAYNGTPEVLVIAYANVPWDKRQLGGVWKLDKLPPVPMIEVDCTPLSVDPSLVYHLLRFYVDNPAARVELGTDFALQRVRAASFE